MTDRAVYDRLCDDDLLRRAAADVDVETDIVLAQLSDDLRAWTYQPAGTAATDAARDQVVAAALALVLMELFPADLPCDPDADQVVAWLSRTIERGFTRVYAARIEPRAGGGHAWLVDRVRQEAGDADAADLVAKLLHSPAGRNVAGPLLETVGLVGINRLLRQVRVLGRHEGVERVATARIGHDVIVLVDAGPHLDWVLPAVDERFREAVAKIGCSIDPAKVQSPDLARGATLEFLGYEISAAPGPHGGLRVASRRVGPVTLPTHALLPPPAREAVKKKPATAKSVPPEPPEDDVAPVQSPARSRFRHRATDLTSAFTWLDRFGHVVGNVWRKAGRIQASWRHLPITLCPIFALMFGWRSPVAIACAALIPVLNWRSIPAVLMFALRHWWQVALAGGGVATLVWLGVTVSRLYPYMSRDTAAPKMPPGFFLGQFNPDPPRGTKLLHYGLYVPPHFRHEPGPVPLIVYLSGYGERTKDRVFAAGLPHAVMHWDAAAHGPFGFAVFMPVNETGDWRVGGEPVADTMRMLDHVMGRYNIDPARVYLTGGAGGGNGVWTLAQGYPDRWAALAPLGAWVMPDVEKVRHIPVWMFHGANDKFAPVRRARVVADELKAAGADVRYTVVPNKGYVVFHEVYDGPELFNWFNQKSRR